MTFLAETSRHATTRARRVSLDEIVALWRERRALARLDARALEDIGLTREAALREARRPIWDVPRHWIG